MPPKMFSTTLIIVDSTAKTSALFMSLQCFGSFRKKETQIDKFISPTKRATFTDVTIGNKKKKNLSLNAKIDFKPNQSFQTRNPISCSIANVIPRVRRHEE